VERNLQEGRGRREVQLEELTSAGAHEGDKSPDPSQLPHFS